MVTLVQNSTLPTQEKVSTIDQIGEAAVGMTLRDYYIAHAPVEPQDWFKPKMDFPRPLIPDWSRVQDPVLREELIQCVNLDVDAESAKAIEWLDQRATIAAEQLTWDDEFSKKRYTQWPAAWADEMLNARLA